jgi:hypothetical protein
LGEIAFDIYDARMQPVPYPAPKKQEETITAPVETKEKVSV